MVFRLYLSGSHPWPRLRAAWGDVVAALTGASEPWRPQPRPPGLPHPDDGAFVQIYTQSGARLTHRVVCTGGTPREGAILESGMTMGVQTSDGEVDLSMTSSGHRQAGPHELRCSGPLDGAVFDRIRAALTAALGQGLPPSASGAVWAHNIRAIVDTEPERARTWLAAALPTRPRPGRPGIAELLELRDLLHGTSEAHLRQRLRASPERLDAWLQARRRPPQGYTVRRIEAIIDRLRPWSSGAMAPPFDSPEPTGWRRVDTGQPADCTIPSTVTLAAAVLPELRLCVSTRDLEPIPGGELITQRTARFGRSGLPLVHVVRTVAVQGQPRSRQAWVWGPAADDCLRIVDCWGADPGAEGGAGSWLHLTGSAWFRQRVAAALASRCPHPLVPEIPDLTRSTGGLCQQEGLDRRQPDPGLIEPPVVPRLVDDDQSGVR